VAECNGNAELALDRHLEQRRLALTELAKPVQLATLGLKIIDLRFVTEPFFGGGWTDGRVDKSHQQDLGGFCARCPKRLVLPQLGEFNGPSQKPSFGVSERFFQALLNLCLERGQLGGGIE